MSRDKTSKAVKAYYDLLGIFTNKKYDFERGLIAAAEKDSDSEHHGQMETHEALDEFIKTLNINEKSMPAFKGELLTHYSKLKTKEIEHGVKALASAATTYALFHLSEHLFAHKIEHNVEKLIGHSNANAIGQVVVGAHNIHTVNEVVEGANHIVSENLKREDAIQKIKEISKRYNLNIDNSPYSQSNKTYSKAEKTKQL